MKFIVAILALTLAACSTPESDKMLAPEAAVETVTEDGHRDGMIAYDTFLDFFTEKCDL